MTRNTKIITTTPKAFGASWMKLRALLQFRSFRSPFVFPCFSFPPAFFLHPPLIQSHFDSMSNDREQSHQVSECARQRQTLLYFFFPKGAKKCQGTPITSFLLPSLAIKDTESPNKTRGERREDLSIDWTPEQSSESYRRNL